MRADWLKRWHVGGGGLADARPEPSPARGQLKHWQAAVFAIAVTTATFGLRIALDSRLGGQPTLVIFTLPIMLSAYVGGLRAGLLATAITFFGASYYLLPPLDSFAIASSIQRWQQFFLLLTGISISGLSEALHRSRLRAALALASRKRAEAANERSVQRLTEAQRVGQIGDWDFDIATGAITWSPQTFEILGRDPSLGPPRNYEENAALYEPESAALMSEKVAQAIASGEPQEYELVALRPDGSRAQLQARAVPMADESGKVSTLHGTVQDISASKRAEAAVRASEGKLRKVIDGLGPHMFVGLMTPDGVLVEANRPALEAAGLAPEDVLGKPFVDTYWWAWSEAVQERLRAAIERAAAGMDSRYDVQVRVAEGSLIWIDFSLFPVHGPGGDVIYLVPSANVIDERKNAEARVQQLNAALEQRVRERTAQLQQLRDLSRRLGGMEDTERRNISRELHDRVGPNLVALKLSLGMMHTALPADGSDRDALADAREVLEQTIAQLRNVMSDLRPPALDDYGLLAAIRSYAERYGARLDAEVRVEGADLSPRPSLAVETALFRIAQEALNNIAKHAQARSVVVAGQRNASGITLTITDDGVGFDAASVTGPGGLGLKTMRERAQGLGAEFSIESRPGGPTCIRVHLASAPP